MTEVDVAEGNYFGAWRVLIAGADGGRLHETDELLFTSVPLPLAFFNSAFVKPPARVADHVDTIVDYFVALGLPFTVRCRADDVDAAAACESRGVTPGGSAPVMFGDATAIADGPVGDVRIVDETTLGVYRETMGAGFGMSEDVLAPILTPRSLATDFVALLAYDEAEPVASAGLYISDGCAGVYNVGTPPARRKRGFGEAVTRAAVAEAVRRGCTTTTLQASAMGFPIYERMGYRTVVTWDSYTGTAPQ